MKDESWGHFRGKEPQTELNLHIVQAPGIGRPEEGQQLPTCTESPSWAMRTRARAPLLPTDYLSGAGTERRPFVQERVA